MDHIKRLNKEVTLISSHNKHLEYPCKGLLVDVEFNLHGGITWATFRPSGTGCKVLVKFPQIV